MTDFLVSLDNNLALILQVKIFIPEEQKAEFFEHFKRAYDLAVAEPECLFFVLGQNPEEPGSISWIEGWSKGLDWLWNVQLKKPYYEPYLAATEPMFTKPREYAILTPEKGFNNLKATSSSNC